MADQVARALNHLSGSDFTELLSSNDRRNFAHFIEDFFCSAPNDQADQGAVSGEHEYHFQSAQWISIAQN